jgi:hypothetical protein
MADIPLLFLINRKAWRKSVRRPLTAAVIADSREGADIMVGVTATHQK